MGRQVRFELAALVAAGAWLACAIALGQVAPRFDVLAALIGNSEVTDPDMRRLLSQLSGMGELAWLLLGLAVVVAAALALRPGRFTLQSSMLLGIFTVIYGAGQAVLETPFSAPTAVALAILAGVATAATLAASRWIEPSSTEPLRPWVWPPPTHQA